MNQAKHKPYCPACLSASTCFSAGDQSLVNNSTIIDQSLESTTATINVKTTTKERTVNKTGEADFLDMHACLQSR